jgi:olefin beta-lactone synthetase
MRFGIEKIIGGGFMNPIGYEMGAHVRNNVTEFLRELVEMDPDRVLLSWLPSNAPSHSHLDARTLWTLVRKTAAGFESLGIKKGDRVLVFLPMIPPLYVTMFALEHLGAIPVFLDGWARRDELGVSAEIAEPKGIVTFPQAFALIQEIPQLASLSIRVAFGGDVPQTVRLETLMQTVAERGTEPVEQEDTALITFTTGSSGRPKGADRTHRFLAAQHYALNRHLPYGISDADLPVFPIFSLNNLASGVRTVLPCINLSQPSPQDADLLLKQFQSENVTCATLSPWLFSEMGKLCAAKNIQIPQLRRLVTGGAPVSRDDMMLMQKAAPQAEIYVLYGSTEVEPIAHISVKELLALPSRANEDEEWVENGVNVGVIDAGLQSHFLKITEIPTQLASDEDWAPLEVRRGEVGELVVMGEHVCRHYFRDPEAFQRAKIVDAKGNIWHRTGDLGFVDKRGHLWLVGRVHNAILHQKGYLFPVRAEMVLRKLSFVAHAAFLGMPTAQKGIQEAWCVLECRSNAPDATTCREAVTRVMNKNGIPFDKIIFVDEIPMDARHHSKVEYATLRHQLLEKSV